MLVAIIAVSQYLLLAADRCGAVPALRLAGHARDEAGARMTPAAGQPGHGLTASLRGQPAGLAEGRVEGGNAGAFEVICRDREDRRYLDYLQVPPPPHGCGAVHAGRGR
jgi:hypothetical protein